MTTSGQRISLAKIYGCNMYDVTCVETNQIRSSQIYTDKSQSIHFCVPPCVLHMKIEY